MLLSHKLHTCTHSASIDSPYTIITFPGITCVVITVEKERIVRSGRIFFLDEVPQLSRFQR